MPLIVETGSGLSNAESFISVADADSYFAARGNAAWTGTDTVKEQALRKATDFMQGRYINRWKGTRTHETQALAWPRENVTDADGYALQSSVIPKEVKYACAELAVRSLTASLLPDNLTPNIKSESVSIPGPISKSIAYTGAKTSAPAFLAVDRMLIPYLVDTDTAERG
jgi:hypothetical protein